MTLDATSTTSPQTRAGSPPDSDASLAMTLAEHRAILASALDPIITIDARGVIRSASESVRRVFGYAPGELRGRNVSILMPEPHRSAHGGYLANYHRTGKTSILGRPRRFDGVRKDGSVFPIEISVARVDVPNSDEPLFTAIIRDVTEETRAAAELALIKQLALAIGEAPHAGDALDEVLDRIRAHTGWDYAEAWLPAEDGQTLTVASIRHDDRPELAALAARTLTLIMKPGEGLPGRVWRNATPEWIPELGDPSRFVRSGAVAATDLRAGLAVPILAGGRVVVVLVFLMRDHAPQDPELVLTVTAAAAPLGRLIDRRRVEDELDHYRGRLESLVAERTGQLEASQEQLRLADRLASIGTLAAGLGHDMNNVLLPVRCRLDAIDAGRLPHGLREHFQAVRRSMAYLQRLADGLRLLALDPEDHEATDGSTDLARWWEETGALLRKAVPQHTRFEADFAPDLPPVNVPSHRLTQAILNLVVNAGEAIDPGGRVTLWARPDPDQPAVRIGVADDGYGMTDEVRQRALDPFFSTKRRGMGTGLGLPLVHGVVRSAGGSMTIDSAPGRGTTIVLTFPAASAAASGGAEGAAPRAAVSIADPRAATFIAAFLRAARFNLYEADPAEPGEPDLWVTEPTPEALSTLTAARPRDARPHVLLFGRPGPEWSAIDATRIDDPDDFDRIREAVAEAAAIVAGAPT
ncbi:MAG: PAS domain S-box protein [Phycisphaeraceae bacterium]|nr:PAS domain S-box protein [Phycisphaeraceae bacterium]